MIATHLIVIIQDVNKNGFVQYSWPPILRPLWYDTNIYGLNDEVVLLVRLSKMVRIHLQWAVLE